ncbi:hypothetical protein [Emticicia agri]|uniref:DUF748 domain-containing protein n=1 Tax=Emticicia agri TaxID=2492393 RepID=A0A4Q5LZX5_9BACT|nr:hypothetical protein [Emticicia agri]RYU95275.1 hypothetical protein EWM59_12550 [Emticicia agri]
MKIRHRWQKITIGIISSILILLIILTIVGFFFLKPIVTSRIEKGVSKATNSLYRISFSDITYNPTLGNIVISDVDFLPDTLIYNRLHAIKKAPDDLLKIHVPTVKLTGVYPLSVIFTKILDMGMVNIDKPTITVLHKSQPYNKSIDSVERKTPYQLISKFVKSLKIDRVLLNDVDFTYENQEFKKPKTNVIKNVYVEITNIVLDSLSDKSTQKIYYADDYTFIIKDITLPDKNQLNDNLFRNVVFSLRNRQLKVDEYHLKPRADNMTFGKISGGRDRAEVLFQNIIIKGIQPEMLFPDNKLYAPQMSIKGGFVRVFNDKRYPRKKRNKVGEYPHQMLKKLDIKLKIDTVQISDVKVTYSEFDPEARLTGYISFERIKGTIYNATNDTLPLLKNPVCSADFHTYFMNKGSLDVHFTFNTPSEKGDFTVQGQLGYFEGTSINKITIALAKVSIQSLQISKYVFKLKGDDNRVTGTGTLYYDNLKATLLKVQDDQLEEKKGEPRKRLLGIFKRKPLPTFIINNLILKDSNPRKSGKLVTGNVNLTRDPTKSFWGVVWNGLGQSLFQCVTGTVKD